MRPPLAWLAMTAALAAPSYSVAQDRFFDSDGVQIRYIELGAGQPIVLVHGYTLSSDHWVRSGVMQTLSKHHRVIALDLRGHGRSDKPHDPRQYGQELERDVIRLLDHLEIEQAHVVGFSMGGGVVARLLTVYPERLLSATLAEGWGRRQRPAGAESGAEAIAAEMERGSLRSILLRQVPAGQPAPTDAELQTASARHLAGQDVRALAAVMRGQPTTIVNDSQLALVRIPTLAITGTGERQLAGANALKAIVPNLELVVIPGATHAELVGRPEFVEAVRIFIDGL